MLFKHHLQSQCSPIIRKGRGVGVRIGVEEGVADIRVEVVEIAEFVKLVETSIEAERTSTGHV